ncbi:hypothetical protein [Parafrankia sp. Ea1.12]|uniref:hypothetical protein n=1 Tax=Parafrankia sp. Ea1.12 TaxID=573499 RepID=UPI000DD31947|nr:hypothetical protein [Parafrankia sp. Ea1.12]
MEDGWDRVPDLAEWSISIPTDDASIARRRRALAPIEVLTDIERTKTSLDGDFWPHYDLFNIALAVIDQVALAMGISAGRSWEEILEYAAEQAARQVPDAGSVQWQAVAERVVVSLVTTDVEIVPYLVHTTDGPRWRAQRFRLLYMYVGSDGSEHLRASEQAINIFIDALDLDIEAAQIANEAQLRALIDRGAIESAVTIARHARYRSIQFQERIRRIVADTLIDPDTHDWIDTVPGLLDAALAHVAERLRSETALLDAVADQRSEIGDAARLVAANRLIEILRECRHRHNELHSHLIGARSRLREALDDRFTRPPRAAHRCDVGSDLLEPYFARSTAEAAEAAARLVAAVGGVTTRWWPDLAVLVDELCAEPRTPGEGEPVEEPEFAASDEAEWWEPYEEAVESILASIDEPIRLSQLVARVEDTAPALTDEAGDRLDPFLLVAAVVHAAHRAWSTRLAGRAAGDRLLVGVDTGATMVTGDIRSSDLLLVPATVTADINPPAAQEPALPAQFQPLPAPFDELTRDGVDPEAVS